MKFIELKDCVIAIDSIAHIKTYSNRVSVQIKNENFPIIAEFNSVTEAREIYKNIKEILLKTLDK